MDSATQRAWSWHKQGLDGSLAGSDPATVLGKAGWARSIGGDNPYLTLFARAGIRRAEADSAVAALNIHELPTARGCTYVLGADDFAWALTLGQSAAEATAKILDKLGVSREEIQALEDQTLQLLQGAGTNRTMDPQQLKDRLGPAVLKLGDEGKKKGASTTLPTVLGLLQADGRIRRVSTNGRFDQQRYTYTAWGLPTATESPEQARAKLMENHLRWTGGATLKQTQWFTSFTVAQTKAALAAVHAVEVRIEEIGGVGLDGVGLGTAGIEAKGAPSLWMLPADSEAAAGFEAPEEEQIQLLAGSDSLFLLRRNAGDHFAQEDRDHLLLNTKYVLQADLPDHPIVDRGRIIGLWQYDPGQERIAHWLFGAPTDAVEQRIREVEAFIGEDLGDFRSYSLDSPSSRQKRIDALNQAGS